MSEADDIRGYFSNALEEAELFDGMPREECTRHWEAFKNLPDSVIISMARNIRTAKRREA